MMANMMTVMRGRKMMAMMKERQWKERHWGMHDGRTRQEEYNHEQERKMEMDEHGDDDEGEGGKG